MNDVRIGRSLRALRRRKRLRQVDVAAQAGVSQSTISLVERGHIATLSIRVLRGIFSAVGASLDVSASWRGGALDRILDERHAALVSASASRLARLGWETETEVTFSEYGDRGSIDILALRRTDSHAVVVEVKTELTAIDETIRRLDVKDRLASRIVFARLGWRPKVVSRLLVVRDSATARRRVGSHEGVFASALPDRGDTVRTWLRQPAGRLSGLQFSSPSDPGAAERPVVPGGGSRTG